MKKVTEIIRQLLEFIDRIYFWLRNRFRFIHA
jgi:hypothetical protein